MNEKETHIIVQEEISNSEESELLAADIYINAGYLVYTQYKKPKAETKEEIKKNGDRGDLIVFDKYGKGGIVEVKRLSSVNRFAYFREARDYVNGVIIDRKETFDKKTNKPTSYIIFNHPMTYFFTVKCKDKEDWTVRKEYCDSTGQMEDCYISKTIDCEFYKTEDKLIINPKKE